MDDKYLQISLEELVVDDAFINWVKDGTDDNQWQNWLNNHPDKNQMIEQAKQLVSKLKFKEVQNAELVAAKENIWQKIEKSTTAKEVTLQVHHSRRRWLIGLTAAASIALLSIFFLPEQGTVIKTEIASSEQLSLPSKSVVELAELSSISYKEDLWSERRDVELDGRAHFEVTKGVPFKVTTDNGTVEVLGTQFDVLSKGSTFQVKVTEGRVSANSGNHQKILTAGMSLYKNPKWTGADALNKEWKTGQAHFIFERRPLSETIAAITYFWGITIDPMSIDIEQAYTGSFDTTEGIDVALQSVLWPMGIDYELTDQMVHLRPRE